MAEPPSASRPGYGQDSQLVRFSHQRPAGVEADVRRQDAARFSCSAHKHKERSLKDHHPRLARDRNRTCA